MIRHFRFCGWCRDVQYFSEMAQFRRNSVRIWSNQVQFRPMSSNIWPTSVTLGRNRSEVGRLRSHLAKTGTNLREDWPMSVKFAPNRSALAKLGPALAEIDPSLADFGLSLAEFGPILGDVGRNRHRLGRCRLDSARFDRSRPECRRGRSTLGRHWQPFVEVGPNSTDIGPNLVEIGPSVVQHLTDIGQIRPNSVRALRHHRGFRRVRVRRCQASTPTYCWTKSGPALTKFRLESAEVGPSSRTCSPVPSKAHQIRRDSYQIWPQAVQAWSTSAAFCPKAAPSWSDSPSGPPTPGSIMARLWSNSTIDRVRPKFGQLRPKFGQLRSK